MLSCIVSFNAAQRPMHQPGRVVRIFKSVFQFRPLGQKASECTSQRHGWCILLGHVFASNFMESMCRYLFGVEI